MIKIKRTKNFSIKQVYNMVKNLKEKYNKACSIECDCRSWSDEPIFMFYIADTFHKTDLKAWDEILELYNKWINKEV